MFNRLLVGLIALVVSVGLVGSVSADDAGGTLGLGDGEQPWGYGLDGGTRWEVTPTWDEYISFRSYTNVLRHRDGEMVLFSELEAEYAPQGRLSSYRFTESRSMAPYIDTDDKVFLAWNPTEVEIGDVIGTWQSDCPWTHRVYSIAGDAGYRTWGDNQIMPDRCIVEPENVLYKVVGIAKDFYAED